MDQNPHQNRRLALSKMDQNGITLESTPRLEQQDRRLQRQAVAMARDIQPYSTQNPLIKSIQPKNNEKQRKKKRLAAAAMAINGS